MVSPSGGPLNAFAPDTVNALAGPPPGGTPNVIAPVGSPPIAAAQGGVGALVDTAWGDLATTSAQVDVDVTDAVASVTHAGHPSAAPQGTLDAATPSASTPSGGQSDASLPSSGATPDAVAPKQAIAPPAPSELLLDAELLDDDDDILIPESFDAEPETRPAQAAAPNAQEPKPPDAIGTEALAVDDILEEAEVMSVEPHKVQAAAEPAWDVFTDESSLSASTRSDAADASPSTPPAILPEAPRHDPASSQPPPPAVAAAGHEDGLLDVMEFEDLPDVAAPVTLEVAEPKVTPPEASVITASEQEQVAQLDAGSLPEDLPVSVHSDAPAPTEVIAPRSEVQASPVENATVPQDVDADALEFSLAGPSSEPLPSPAAPAPEASEPWQVAAAPKPVAEPAVLAVAPPPEAAPAADESRTGIPPEFEVALIPEGASPQESRSAEAPEPASIAATPEPVPEAPAAPEPRSEAVAYLDVDEDVPSVAASAPEATDARAQAEAPAAPPEDTTPPKPRLVVSPAPAPARERTPISIDDLSASSEEPMQLASTWEFVGWQGGGEGEGKEPVR